MLVLILSNRAYNKKRSNGRRRYKAICYDRIIFRNKTRITYNILSVYVGAIYGIGSIIYSKIKKKEFNSMIPYGPFISVGAFISILYGTSIIDWYIGLF